MSFTTATGLGVHRRRAHPVEANAMVSAWPTKARWTEEEMRILATAEAAAEREGVMNMRLLPMNLGRSLDALKGLRNKNAKYREILAQQRVLTEFAP